MTNLIQNYIFKRIEEAIAKSSLVDVDAYNAAKISLEDIILDPSDYNNNNLHRRPDLEGNNLVIYKSIKRFVTPLYYLPFALNFILFICLCLIIGTLYAEPTTIEGILVSSALFIYLFASVFYVRKEVVSAFNSHIILLAQKETKFQNAIEFQKNHYLDGLRILKLKHKACNLYIKKPTSKAFL